MVFKVKCATSVTKQKRKNNDPNFVPACNWSAKEVTPPQYHIIGMLKQLKCI